MNIEKEFGELISSFKEGGILTRIFICLGFFFSISSVTSLSGAIIEWKGFILEGLNFYHLYFVEPISSFATAFGFKYSQQEIHTATVCSVCVAIGMRIQALGSIVAYRNINIKYHSDLKPDMRIYWIITIVFPLGAWIWYGIADPTIRPLWTTFVAIGLPIFIILPRFIMSKFGYENYEKEDFSYFKSYYIYISALLLVVCILGAINLGLGT